MSTNLAIRLSEQAFETLAQQAISAGKTPEEMAALVVETLYAGDPSKPVDAESARAEFLRCFGSVDLGKAIGVANETIDADLATEYGAASGPT